MMLPLDEYVELPEEDLEPYEDDGYTDDPVWGDYDDPLFDEPDGLFPLDLTDDDYYDEDYFGTDDPRR